MRQNLQKTVLLLLAIFSCGVASLFAQIPQAINFQAIARDAESNPMVNTNIQIRLSVVDETPDGTVVYQELRALQTNAYGSFSFQIGVGADFVTIGTMEEIEWETGSKYLKIDYDPTNTFSFDLTLGTIEFVSIPYAFAAETVVFIDATDAADGDVLVYNETTGKFEPGTVTAGSVTWDNVQDKPDFTNWDTDATDDFSGDYNDLTNAPTLFDGDYSSLANLPTLFNGSYDNLTDIPANLDTDATDDFSGDYNDLINTPTLFDGDYNSLTNIPTGQTVPENVSEFTNDAGYLTEYTETDPEFTAWDKDYDDLTNTPTLFDGDYSSLANLPTLFNGSYDNLTDIPANLDTDATDDFSGDYNDLVNKPVIDGSETTIIAGSNVSVSGSGTVADPYIVTATGGGSASLPPTVTTLAATDILSFSTTLNGTVNANGFSSTVVFEWGTTTAYGNTTEATPSTVTGVADTDLSKALTGLQSNTTYHYHIKATNAVDITYSDDMTFTTSLSAPQLTTTAISSILAFTATSGGNITYDGGSPVTTRGVCWSTSPSPTTANTHVASGDGTGTFTINLTGLTHATTYYLRAYATNAVGTTYGNELTFTTQSGVVSLTTNTITAITGITATSGGNIAADGGSTVSSRGVCWSTTTGPTTANAFTNDGSGTGAFTSSLTGLALGITYYVRAYATNAVGTTYGNERSFTTIALPTVSTTDANDIKGNSAKAGGVITNNGGSTVTAQGLCWSTTANPTTANNITTSFTAVMTSLSPNTTYYVRAYATNIAGTGYGNEISFNSGRLIGSSYAGGLVFYNDGAGHGLVCAESDQSTGAKWGCDGTTIGGTSTAINTGAANTNAIVAGCTTAGIAAKICYDLDLNSNTDWYLPSKDELYLMYVNLHTQSLGDFASSYYWSSSEYNSDYAWNVYFSGGYTHGSHKNSTNYVRAVRAF